MTNLIRRRLDEILTGIFLLAVLVATILRPPVFATPGGLLLARCVLWGAGTLIAILLVTARFSSLAHRALRIAADIGPVVVAIVGYVSLRLLGAYDITAWLRISAKDPWMMTADNLLFGKTPFLWFAQWGLDSRPFLQVMSWFYVLYPFTPIIALAWFMYKRDRAQFRLVRRALLVSFYCGYCCYLLIPVAGPLSLLSNTPVPYIETTVAYTFLAGNFRYPFDCFPSLHTANPWLILWLSRGKVPARWMTAAVIVCCGITLSTVALQLHYGVDGLAGLA